VSLKVYAGPNLGAGTGDTLIAAPKYGLRKNASERALLTFHGHGADAYTWRPGVIGSGNVARRLAELGWVIVSDDFGGVTPWANDAALADADVVHGFATGSSTIHAPNCQPVVDIMGWSMGGLTALNWIKRNAAKVHRAVLWAPATHITTFHDTNSGYATEIEADYGGAAAWAASIVGHEPSSEPANYRGLPPIRIYQGDADPTVPLAQTQSFVDAVNDPNLAIHVLPGGTHTNLFGLVNPDDIAEFLWGKVPA
jgi:alpha-beta hydrolase superfamily lysophospholipase